MVFILVYSTSDDRAAPWPVYFSLSRSFGSSKVIRMSGEFNEMTSHFVHFEEVSLSLLLVSIRTKWNAMQLRPCTLDSYL